MRFIQRAIVRGYKLVKSYIAEQRISGEVTGQMLRHCTHILGLAGSLEAGGPNVSTVDGEHEFSIPGIYTCPDGQLASFQLRHKGKDRHAPLRGFLRERIFDNYASYSLYRPGQNYNGKSKCSQAQIMRV